jgi:putative oxidoreductase
MSKTRLYAGTAFFITSGTLATLPAVVQSVTDFLYQPLLQGWAAAALLILRIGFGGLLMLHARPKLLHTHQWSKFLGVPLPLCVVAAVAMLLGAIALIVGFLTPLACIGLVILMGYAMVQEISEGQPFIARDPYLVPEGQYTGPRGQAEPPSFEKAFIYNLVLIAIAILGPGQYSLDALLLN